MSPQTKRALENHGQTHARAMMITQNAQREPILGGMDTDTLLSIIKVLLPLIIKCFMPSDGQESQRYVSKRYNASNANNQYGGYDKRIVKSTARQALRAGRQQGTRLTWDQAYQIGIKTLDDVRTGDASQASLIISETNDFDVL